MFSDEIYLLLAPLAVWRITYMVWTERIFQPLRKLFGEVVEAGVESYPDTWYGYLINCFYCLSVHISICITVVLYLCPILILPLALSTVAIWMQKVNEKCLS